MTLREAYTKLRPPLVFGDKEQIKAANFIAAVEDAIAKMRFCSHEESLECDECDGVGVLSADVKKACIGVLRSGWPSVKVAA